MSREEQPTVITLSAEEILRLEIVLTDRDPEEALAFLRLLRERVHASTQRGMQSHLDR